jgi:hypothetical protein
LLAEVIGIALFEQLGFSYTLKVPIADAALLELVTLLIVDAFVAVPVPIVRWIQVDVGAEVLRMAASHSSPITRRKPGTISPKKAMRQNTVMTTISDVDGGSTTLRGTARLTGRRTITPPPLRL